MNKQTLAYLYNIMLFRNEMEWTIDIFINIGKLQTNYMSKRSQTNKYILYDLMYIMSIKGKLM